MSAESEWTAWEPHAPDCSCAGCEEFRVEHVAWEAVRKAEKQFTFQELYGGRKAGWTMREFEELRKQARDVAREAGALKDEVRMSEKHAGAKKQADGSWVCEVCKAESFDAEMFEQAGDDFGCMKLAVKMGLRKERLEPVQPAGVLNARKWIEAAKAVSSAGTHERMTAYEDAMRMSYKALEAGGKASGVDRAVLNEIARKNLAARDEFEKLAEKVGGAGAALPVEALVTKVNPKREVHWQKLEAHSHGTHFVFDGNKFKNTQRKK